MSVPQASVVDAAHGGSARNLGLLLARVLLAPLFLYSGTGKVLAFSLTASRLPGGEFVSKLLTVGAITVELGCGIALILGILVRPAAAVLIAFTIAATLMFHQFWAAPDPQVQAQTVNFLKNLGLVGSLAMIMIFGPGACTLRGQFQKRSL
jgi:putative oxidoreductase